MNFQIKSLMQTVFGLMPNSEEINYFAQKHITKRLPPSSSVWMAKFNQAIEHHKVFSAYGPNEGSVVYEIGCGWHLAMALAFSTFGYDCVKALDVTNHVRPELVNVILQHMKDNNVIQGDIKELNSKNMKEDLWDQFGIELLAPVDSANTGMAEKSVDYIYSQEVFEHIPPHLLLAIMKECHRVLKDNGIISFAIDYADHYCSIDKSITPYNFLRYSEKKWKKYNPDLHYVNRLRHADFLKIFERAGFDVVEETTVRPDNWEEMIREFPFDEEFTSRYTLNELGITSARIVLKKHL